MPKVIYTLAFCCLLPLAAFLVVVVGPTLTHAAAGGGLAHEASPPPPSALSLLPSNLTCPFGNGTFPTAEPGLVRCSAYKSNSCCNRCNEVSLEHDLILLANDSLCLLLPSSCLLLVEQIFCGLYCDPNNLPFVAQEDSGNFTIVLCSSFSQQLNDSCTSPTLSSDVFYFLLDTYVQLTVGNLSVSIAPSNTPSSKCLAGPPAAALPHTSICCDVLSYSSIPQSCSLAQKLNQSFHLQASTCDSSGRNPSGVPSAAPPPPGGPALTLSPAGTPSPPSAGSCPGNKTLSPGPVLDLARCPGYRAHSCCTRCVELGSEVELITIFNGTTSNGTTLCQLLPSSCQLLVEEIFCGLNCDANALSFFVRDAQGNFSISLCPSFSQQLNASCITWGDADAFYELLNKVVFLATYENYGISIAPPGTSSTQCFAGAPSKIPPPTSICCDPLPASTLPSSCPGLNQSLGFSGDLLNVSDTCNAAGLVQFPPASPQPSPQTHSPPSGPQPSPQTHSPPSGPQPSPQTHSPPAGSQPSPVSAPPPKAMPITVTPFDDGWPPPPSPPPPPPKCAWRRFLPGPPSLLAGTPLLLQLLLLLA